MLNEFDLTIPFWESGQRLKHEWPSSTCFHKNCDLRVGIPEAFVLGEGNCLPAVTTLIRLYVTIQYPILRMRGRSRLWKLIFEALCFSEWTLFCLFLSLKTRCMSPDLFHWNYEHKISLVHHFMENAAPNKIRNPPLVTSRVIHLPACRGICFKQSGGWMQSDLFQIYFTQL